MPVDRLKSRTIPYLLLAVCSICIAAGAIFTLPFGLSETGQNALDIGIAQSISDQISSLSNPLDFWFDRVAGGFPYTHHEPFFAPFFVAAVHVLLLKILPVEAVYRLITIFLLMVLPWIVYRICRQMELSEWSSLFAAVLSLSVLSGSGHSLGFYLRSSNGQLAQLFAFIFFLLFIASAYLLISGKKKGWSRPVLFGMLTGLSNLFLLYLGFLIIILIGLLCKKSETRLQALLRMGTLPLLVLLSLAFFLIPLIDDSAFAVAKEGINAGQGAGVVLEELFRGNVFDAGRLPVLSLLCLAGLLICLKRQNESDKILAAGFFLCLALSFGNATFGALLNILPLHSHLPYSKFMIGVQFFGIVLAGIALAHMVEKSAKTKIISHSIINLLLVLFALEIIFAGQGAYLVEQAKMIRQARKIYTNEKPKTEKLLTAIPNEHLRSYAGPTGGWGGYHTLGNIPVYDLFVQRGIPSIGAVPDLGPLAGRIIPSLNEKRFSHLNLFAIGSILSWRDDAYWKKVASPVLTADDRVLYRVATAGLFELVQAQLVVKADKDTFTKPARLWLHSDLLEKRQYLRFVFDDKPNLKSGDKYIEMTKSGRMKIHQLGKDSFFKGSTVSFSRVNPLDYIDTPYPYFGAIQKQEQPGPGIYTATVKADSPCYLLLKCSYHPGWKVWVNGEKKKVEMLSPAFAGVFLEQGTWNVVFKYKTPFYKILLFIASIVMLALLWRRERANRK